MKQFIKDEKGWHYENKIVDAKLTKELDYLASVHYHGNIVKLSSNKLDKRHFNTSEFPNLNSFLKDTYYVYY